MNKCDAFTRWIDVGTFYITLFYCTSGLIVGRNL